MAGSRAEWLQSLRASSLRTGGIGQNQCRSSRADNLVGLKLDLEDMLGIKVDVVSERGLSRSGQALEVLAARPIAQYAFLA